MILSDVSVKRPVFAIMMTAALVVLGAFSYRELGLDLMPKTDSPVVTVNVNLPGASAEEVETQITKRVEEAVNTISGIDELRATSPAHKIYSTDQAAEIVRNGGMLMLMPLCGGIPPEIAWPYLEHVANVVLPQAQE